MTMNLITGWCIMDLVLCSSSCMQNLMSCIVSWKPDMEAMAILCHRWKWSHRRSEYLRNQFSWLKERWRTFPTPLTRWSRTVATIRVAFDVRLMKSNRSGLISTEVSPNITRHWMIRPNSLNLWMMWVRIVIFMAPSYVFVCIMGIQFWTKIVFAWEF